MSKLPLSKDAQIKKLARELVRDSIIEDAASRFVEMVLKEAHDSGIKPLQARIEELEAKLKTYDEIGWALEEDAGQLRAKLAKAVEALEFYATRVVTYHNVGTVTFHGGDDNGQTARAALTEISGGGDT